MNAPRTEIEAALAVAVDAESLVGIRWWPGHEMAPIAYRRWFSFARRHDVRRATDDRRIEDLAKGLQARFEPGTLHTPFSEFVHLAEILARVFARYDLLSE
jgi:hypothetical protein